MLQKPKKPKSKAYFRRKADKLLQELVHSTYDYCLVCGKPVTAGHHYFPKSTAGNLRYHWENIIPLCQGCHFSLHNSNPSIQNAINAIKGKEWLENLEIAKRNFLKCDTLSYYREICEKLSNAKTINIPHT